MGEVRFMISEAAKQVHVESHVLRYWEEELELVIGRTEMGHRYYTEDDIQLFCCIKKLKDACLESGRQNWWMKKSLCSYLFLILRSPSLWMRSIRN